MSIRTEYKTVSYNHRLSPTTREKIRVAYEHLKEKHGLRSEIDFILAGLIRAWNDELPKNKKL